MLCACILLSNIEIPLTGIIIALIICLYTKVLSFYARRVDLTMKCCLVPIGQHSLNL
jgi:hypothetical protein